ncbi:MAG: SPFH domain-containing protein [Planctomycetota bacterium]|jgi:regulator of protease activity HflC (stomatin/prohibitin superfamily)
MRIDHHAYRKATGVAGFGFLLQAAIALILLVFGQLSRDTVFLFASFYLFGGLFVWLSLIVVFYQHTQERLEALEEDELRAARAGTGSVFEVREEEKVAARRLRLMHKWLMPGVSVLVAAYLGLGAWGMLRYLGRLEEIGGTGTELFLTPRLGWAVAICLSFSAVAFIFSRFVAGMSRQNAWHNLRGGAGYMVGNALVMLAVAVGITFRFFENDHAILGIAFAIPIFMAVLAGEIVFNFILNLYRPRIPGAVPRPAFDSRVLSLFAAPESIVRSLSEAVNYQFGFDITSSWGYQLLLRSFGWLLAFAVLVLIGLNMMVVVEPHQQAVKLSAGGLVGESGGQVHTSGMMWKLPWPMQTAAVYDVSRIRELPLTASSLENPDVQLWSRPVKTDTELDPFIVAGSPVATRGHEASEIALPRVETGGAADAASEHFALVDAEISLRYRIKPDGLLDFLQFTSDEPRRRQRLNMRDGALRALALREITRHLSGLSLEQVIATGRADVISALRERIQAAFDRHRTGVEVVAVNIPTLRPAGEVAKNFEDLAMAKQQRREAVARAEGDVVRSLAVFVGDPEGAHEILAAIDEWRDLRGRLGPEDKSVIDLRLEVERMLAEAGGQLGQEIAAAEARRWISLMEARAKAKHFQGQLAAYRAAPTLFQQREIMRELSRVLAGRRKFLMIGIDPERLNLDFDLQEAPSLFGIPSQGESEQ